MSFKATRKFGMRTARASTKFTAKSAQSARKLATNKAPKNLVVSSVKSLERAGKGTVGVYKAFFRKRR